MIRANCVASLVNEQGKVVYDIKVQIIDSNDSWIQTFRYSELLLFATGLKKNLHTSLPAFPSKFKKTNRQEKLDMYFNALSNSPSQEVQLALQDFLQRATPVHTNDGSEPGSPMKGRELLRSISSDRTAPHKRQNARKPTLIVQLRAGQLDDDDPTKISLGVSAAVDNENMQKPIRFAAFKRGGFNTAWQLRHFECRGCDIRYFATAQDAQRGHNEKGRIRMSAVKTTEFEHKHQSGRVDIVDASG